jgi:hypothetical protein
MAVLPTRTLSDDPQEHLDDHNAIHPLFDVADLASAANGTVLTKTGGVWVSGSVASGTVMLPEILVASNDMPTDVKNNADYVCDGTADQVQINSAIDQAAAIAGRSDAGGTTTDSGEQRGVVQLSGGRFNISAAIQMRTATWLRGMGPLTQIRAISVANTGMVMLLNTSVHLSRLSDMWLDGNYASGGTTASAVHYVSASSGDDHNTYPSTGNDPTTHIERLLMMGFSNNANRHGIRLQTDLRVSSIKSVMGRSIGGHGIWMDGSPDSHLENIHVGVIGGRGFYIQGANNRIVNCKAFYCESWGFEVTSGYAQVSGFEAQDSVNGFRVAGSHFTGSALTVDTCDTTGLEIASSGAVVNGFQVASRSGGRYANCDTGINFSGSPQDTVAVGRVDSTNVTTRIAGTYTHASNFVRITGNASLTSQG